MWQKKNEATKSVMDVCLQNLGVQNTEQINDWFRKSYANQYKVDLLDDAVRLIEKHKSSPIYIMGDYDADGVMATSIMLIALRRFGCKRVNFMIPHRHSEGYGLNMRMIEDVAAETKQARDVLIITVDNGINCFEQIAKAKSYGWDILLTDHHLGLIENDIKVVPKDADVVINPAFLDGTATFAHYCGAGLAYKLAINLIGDKAKDLISLAAIATFADVMPLREENFVITRNGLKKMTAKNVPCGLKTLIEVNELDTVEDMDVLFRLAPEINAPGRLLDNGAELCVRLMTEEMPTKAISEAREIVMLNNQRKAMVKTAMEGMEFKDSVDAACVKIAHNTNPGIVGIIAGNVCEATKKPSIVFTESSKDNVLVGSARSIDGVHLKNILDELQNEFQKAYGRGILVAFGGHAGAAGLSIKKDDFDTFASLFTKKVKAIVESPSFDSHEDDVEFYDLEISESEVNEAILTQTKFAPFGEGNPKPVFKISNFRPWNTHGPEIREIGADGIKLIGRFADAVAFEGRNNFAHCIPDTPLALIGTLSVNRFRGRETNQIEIKARA